MLKPKIIKLQKEGYTVKKISQALNITIEEVNLYILAESKKQKSVCFDFINGMEKEAIKFKYYLSDAELDNILKDNLYSLKTVSKETPLRLVMKPLETIIQDYQDNMPLFEIAEKYKFKSYSPIYTILRNNNIVLKNKQNPDKYKTLIKKRKSLRKAIIDNKNKAKEFQKKLEDLEEQIKIDLTSIEKCWNEIISIDKQIIEKKETQHIKNRIKQFQKQLKDTKYKLYIEGNEIQSIKLNEKLVIQITSEQWFYTFSEIPEALNKINIFTQGEI